MPKAVDHDFATGTVTTGWETAKGAAKWLFGPPVIGAIAGGLIGWALSAATIPLSLPVVAGVIIGGGLGTWLSVAAGSVMAGIGAVLGFAKGRERVGKEQEAYEHRSATRAHIADARFEKAQLVGAQQGYTQGIQDGQAMVVERLRQMQYAQIQGQMAEAQKANDAACNKCSHVDAEVKRREAAAAAGAQIG